MSSFFKISFLAVIMISGVIASGTQGRPSRDRKPTPIPAEYPTGLIPAMEVNQPLAAAESFEDSKIERDGHIVGTQIIPKPAAVPRVPNRNQEVANKVATALKRAKLSGFEIEITVAQGVAILEGIVGSEEQRTAAQEAVASVDGVTRIINCLTTKGTANARRPDRNQDTANQIATALKRAKLHGIEISVSHGMATLAAS